MTSLRPPISVRLLVSALSVVGLAGFITPCQAQEKAPPKVYLKVIVVACEGRSLDKPKFQKEIENLRSVIKGQRLTFESYKLVKTHMLECAIGSSIDLNFCTGRRLVISPLGFLKKKIRAVYQLYRVTKGEEGSKDKLKSIMRLQQKSKDSVTFVLAGGAVKDDKSACSELLLVLTVRSTPFPKAKRSSE